MIAKNRSLKDIPREVVILCDFLFCTTYHPS